MEAGDLEILFSRIVEVLISIALHSPFHSRRVHLWILIRGGLDSFDTEEGFGRTALGVVDLVRLAVWEH